MRMDNRPKKNVFKICYLCYVAILLAALIFVFFRVRSLMIAYERNDAANYIEWLLSDAGDSSSEMGKYLEENCFAGLGNGEERREKLLGSLQSGELTYKAVTKGGYDSSHPIYTVYDGSEAIITVALSELSSYTKLGIMTFSEWEIDWCLLRNSQSVGETEEGGAVSYRVLMPENFTLLVDGAETEIPANAQDAVLSEFEYIADFVDEPAGKSFTLSGLRYEAKISALNPSGVEIEPELADGVLTVAASYSSSEEAKTVIEGELNPLEIAKTWSKFMTKDVSGEKYGLYVVREECKLLEGTKLYTQASSWAGSVDITFTSGHTITSWSGDSVDNYIKYNDNLYSCDVYTEKNLLLDRGQKRTDVFNNRMYFAKLGGVWYLIDMITIE